jgi:hypothetical protein
MCRCAWGCECGSGSALQHWQNAGDDSGDSARGQVMMVVMDLRAMVKVCAAVHLLIPHLALEARL